MLTHDCRNSVDIQPGFGRDRTISRKFIWLARNCKCGSRSVFPARCPLCSPRGLPALCHHQLVEHHFIVRRPAGAFYDKNTNSTSPMELLAALFIRRLIGVFLPYAGLGYQHRSPDTRLSMDPHNAVTSCLRLAGGNGDFCPSSLFNNVDLPTFGRPTKQ